MSEEFFRLFIATMIFALGTTYFHLQILHPRYNWLSYATLAAAVLSYVAAFAMLFVALQNL